MRRSRRVSGMGCWTLSRLFQRHLLTAAPALTLCLCLAFTLTGTLEVGGDDEDDAPSASSSSSTVDCDLSACLELFTLAQDSQQIRYDYSAHSPPRGSHRTTTTMSPKVVAARCLALRTFAQCIQNLSSSCKGDLGYHSSHKVIEKQMKQLNCTLRGPVFRTPVNPSNSRGGSGYVVPVCSYTPKGGPSVATVYQHCVLFGDPHLLGFNNTQHTCRIVGAWPLLNNEYLSVQATSESVGFGGGSAINKVTVVIKRNDACAMEHYVTYQTCLGAADPLPSTFDDGQTSFGPADAVRLNVRAANRHVEITLRYIDTTIVLRHIGRHLSVGISAPREVIAANVDFDSARGGSSGGGGSLTMQLCRTGCPVSQRISLVEFFARSDVTNDNKRTSEILPSRRRDVIDDDMPANGGTFDDSNIVSVELALTQCKGLVDFFLDSCVFDVMTTGNSDFALVAREVHGDALRLCPLCVQRMRNRTTLLRDADDEFAKSDAPTASVESRLRFALSIACAITLLVRTLRVAR